jgi:hypothetical protein
VILPKSYAAVGNQNGLNASANYHVIQFAEQVGLSGFRSLRFLPLAASLLPMRR